MSKKRRTNFHHMIPRSRGGTDDPLNVKRVRQDVHDAWHYLFQHRTPGGVVSETPDEAVWRIGAWSDLKRNKLTKRMTPKQRIAWKLIFGDVGPCEAIEIIRNEWTPLSLRNS